MTINEQLPNLTTFITAQRGEMHTSGTGFYYNVVATPEESKEDIERQKAVQREKGIENAMGVYWVQIKDEYVITNRHVVLYNEGDREVFPDELKFHRRIANEVGGVDWLPETLNTSALKERTLFHPNPEVDVAAIRISGLFAAHYSVGNDPRILQHFSLTDGNFPESDPKRPPSTGDAVLVIGYPRGFYDEFNKLPIVKSGIIASHSGSQFGGSPYFLIDAKLFPGSSGSVVISQPTNFVVDGGQLYTRPEKQYQFLGIYSGEPYLASAPIEFDDFTIIRKDGFNVGTVWYAALVKGITTAGIRLDC